MPDDLITILRNKRDLFASKLMKLDAESTVGLLAAVAALTAAENAIGSPDRPSTGGEWSTCKYAIDAILPYLARRGEWTPRTKVIDDILAGGWEEREFGRRWRVDSAIRHHALKSPKPRLRLLENDLVGLAEWPISEKK